MSQYLHQKCVLKPSFPPKVALELVFLKGNTDFWKVSPNTKNTAPVAIPWRILLGAVFQESESWCGKTVNRFHVCHSLNSENIGDKRDLPPLIGNPYNGYIKPYKVDDHPYHRKTMGV